MFLGKSLQLSVPWCLYLNSGNKSQFHELKLNEQVHTTHSKDRPAQYKSFCSVAHYKHWLLLKVTRGWNGRVHLRTELEWVWWPGIKIYIGNDWSFVTFCEAAWSGWNTEPCCSRGRVEIHGPSIHVMVQPSMFFSLSSCKVIDFIAWH